ncbi:hypothetical protein RI129_003780 [Pyrocoelia pectoralis]|uniref:non-specific serine/threonine protein kinase n=1 Tax=Pyrocoelia pectoralis TaxID=417401 RepID=A0AAN7VRC1_9COLE
MDKQAAVLPSGSGTVKKKQTHANRAQQRRKENPEKFYFVEYSRSNVARCRTCEGRIDKHEIRISKKGVKGNHIWHHFACFVENRRQLEYVKCGSILPGFNDLTVQDRRRVQEELPAIDQDEEDLQPREEEVPPSVDEEELTPSISSDDEVISISDEETTKSLSGTDTSTEEQREQMDESYTVHREDEKARRRSLRRHTIFCVGEDSVDTTSGSDTIYEETSYERARHLVLSKCGQEEPLPFEECYSPTTLEACRKIGEGVYAEVFMYQNLDGLGTVMKIIPIEGDQLVNNEPQKEFHEILSEIVIAMELSNLRYNKINRTVGFSELKSVKCVVGRYPAQLIDLWNLYNQTHQSLNDSPTMFGNDQIYIILELAHGGVNVEHFEFRNASQSLSVFKQIAYSLAVAEQACEFEHRDLHWGNVLISKCDKAKLLDYCLNDQEFYMPSNGIEVSIIDFTLSRIKVDNSIIFNDISEDPDLFNGAGEYQFEIYRLMQQKNDNEWEHYEPYSNVLWMHYMLHQMTSQIKYSIRTTKVHKKCMRQLKKLMTNILQCENAQLIIDELL